MSDDQDFELLGRISFDEMDTHGQNPPLGIEIPEIYDSLRHLSPPPLVTEHFPSLAALLDKLSAEHSYRFLYRGQVRPYPGMLPSAYRSAIPNSNVDDPLFAVDQAAHSERLSMRGRARIALLSELMKRLGPTLGNIVAQQYGIGSEAVDLTSDLETAAFFASRQYPAYTPVGSGAAAPGVIYRFPVSRHAARASLADSDSTYSSTWKSIQGVGNVHFGAFRQHGDLSTDELRAIDEINAGHLGNRMVEVLTVPMLRDHQFYLNSIVNEWPTPTGPPSATRLARQFGASARTISHWAASVPATPDIGRFASRPGLLFFQPPFAVGERLIAIENLNRFPGLEIFTFEHTGTSPAIDPEFLWVTSPEVVDFPTVSVPLST